MADRIIKPDSGNDVVIQNNGGTRKIEVTNSGDVEVTGDFKATTVKATNLKANDGTAALVVADSTGEVTSSGGLKATNLKATNLKANDGTAGLVVADSTGRVTFSENNPVIQLGSNATGFTGIKNIDVWHVNSSITGSIDPIGYSSWTRGSSASGAANLGTGMTLNDVSGNGIFTFPVTGIWRVELNFLHQRDGDARYIFDRIKVATDGKSGSFSTKAETRTFIQRTSSDTTFTSAYCTAFLDVTTAGDTGSSTAVSFQIAETGPSTLNGSASQMLSFVAFTRLGDT